MTILAAPLERSTSRFHAYDIMRWLVGVVLLTAAGMKGYELVTGPVAENGLPTLRWFLIVAVEVELALGLCLMGGVWKRQTWEAAVVSFAAFACITVYQAWQGGVSCGCFSRAEVDPRYTLVLDLALLASVMAGRPRLETSPTRRHRAAVVLVALLGTGIPGAVAMASARSASVTDKGDILCNGCLVVLEPEGWVGKQFPLCSKLRSKTDSVRGDGLPCCMTTLDCTEKWRPKY